MELMNDEKNKQYVMLIGGAAGQCHGIKILQSLGYKVIVVDYDPNCIGSKKADEFFCISTDDVKNIEKLAVEKKVYRILSTQSDLGMMTAAKINKRLGLEGIPFELAVLFSNKLKMRNFLKDQGVRHPNFTHCNSYEELYSFAEENGFPLVVKPLDSQGSRGVMVVKSYDELKDILEITKFNRDTKGVIAEDFMSGEEYTVEGIMLKGKHYTLGVSLKKHYKELSCVSNELYYSWNDDYENLSKEHNILIEKTGLKYGVTHSEYIKTDEGFTLVEFAARGGGSMISSHIVPAISGIDPEEIYIRNILGLDNYLQKIKRKCAVLKFVSLQYEKIKEIAGLEDIKKMPEILEFHLEYSVGDKVGHVTNDTNRHGFYIGVADTEEELKVLMSKVENMLKIEYY